MIPLIDADVLRYEIGFSGEYRDEDGELLYREWDFVKGLFDEKIASICAAVYATEPPILFITNDSCLHKMENKKLKKKGKEPKEYEKNFREDIAVKKVYKGTRKQAKPFHYANLTAYIMGGNFDVRVAVGMEADDLMSIHQTEDGSLNTIICSRDKDLRITPGMQYGWACGKQPEFPPQRVDEIGKLELKGGGKKIAGTGLKFFYSQLWTGDQVDNIPGIPRKGPAAAYKALAHLETEEELHAVTAEAYEAYYGDSWREEMKEQGLLLWMVREVDDDGNLVMWEMYDERD